MACPYFCRVRNSIHFFVESSMFMDETEVCSTGLKVRCNSIFAKHNSVINNCRLCTSFTLSAVVDSAVLAIDGGYCSMPV